MYKKRKAIVLKDLHDICDAVEHLDNELALVQVSIEVSRLLATFVPGVAMGVRRDV